MKQCWPEGDLRSYLDGELPPEGMGRAAAHVAQCDACAAAVEMLSARAQRVSALLGELSGAGVAACVPVRRPRHRSMRAAAALAACLALAFILLPKRTRPPVVRHAAAPSAPAATVAVQIPVAHPAAQPVKPHKRPLPRTPEVQYFLALDDDPFELGVVRRVALGPEAIPADVVFSPDGRARAIRLVSDSGN